MANSTPLYWSQRRPIDPLKHVVINGTVDIIGKVVNARPSILDTFQKIPSYVTCSTDWQSDHFLLIAVTLGTFLYILYASTNSKTRYGLPVAGFRPLEPTWLLRLRFIRNSRSILQEGYEKYRDLFVVRRWTGDIVVIGKQKYLEEIRAKTKDGVRSVEPFLIDLAGHSSNQGKVFLESDLQNRVINQKLTPKLPHLIPVMKSHLGIALRKELPDFEALEWTKLDPAHVFAKTIGRIVARVWISEDDCEDEEWLFATTEYAENIFATGFLLRFIPPPLRAIVAPLLPSFRTVLKCVKLGRRITGELVEKRFKSGKRPDDVLQWTMELANSHELELDNLSERMLILSLSAIHTTALTITQALYDLCAHPEYIDELRVELVNVLQNEGEWNKTVLQNFTKLDSLLKESQRFNPIFQLTFNRFLPHDVTLSNGVHLPARTRIAVPQHAILNDPTNVPGPNPDSFDPWRYSRLREDPSNAQKYFFSMPDPSHMAFGYGRYACPGRHYVANEIKIVLAHLLLRYDWKFPDGQARPRNFTIDADMYPDRASRVLMRRRAVEESIKSLVEL